MFFAKFDVVDFTYLGFVLPNKRAVSELFHIRLPGIAHGPRYFYVWGGGSIVSGSLRRPYLMPTIKAMRFGNRLDNPVLRKAQH